jgi:hypothetical protein
MDPPTHTHTHTLTRACLPSPTHNTYREHANQPTLPSSCSPSASGKRRRMFGAVVGSQYAHRGRKTSTVSAVEPAVSNLLSPRSKYSTRRLNCWSTRIESNSTRDTSSGLQALLPAAHISFTPPRLFSLNCWSRTLGLPHIPRRRGEHLLHVR